MLVAHLPVIKSLQKNWFCRTHPALSPSPSRLSSPHPQAGRGRPTAPPKISRSRSPEDGGADWRRSGPQRRAEPRDWSAGTAQGGGRGYIRRERRQQSVDSGCVVAECGCGRRGAARSHSALPRRWRQQQPLGAPAVAALADPSHAVLCDQAGRGGDGGGGRGESQRRGLPQPGEGRPQWAGRRSPLFPPLFSPPLLSHPFHVGCRGCRIPLPAALRPGDGYRLSPSLVWEGRAAGGWRGGGGWWEGAPEASASLLQPPISTPTRRWGWGEAREDPSGRGEAARAGPAVAEAAVQVRRGCGKSPALLPRLCVAPG